MRVLNTFVLLVVGILGAFGILIGLAIVLGPVLTAGPIPRVAIAFFTLAIGVLICWLVSAVAFSLGLASQQRRVVVVLSGALVVLLALVLI